jgi:hypothetical protein
LALRRSRAAAVRCADVGLVRGGGVLAGDVR